MGISRDRSLPGKGVGMSGVGMSEGWVFQEVSMFTWVSMSGVGVSRGVGTQPPYIGP